MIDENLPTFYLSNNRKKHTDNVLFTQHGNELEPAYTLRRLDSSDPDSKNRYAVALYDPYITDVLYGEVLIVPEWSQPTLSADAIRQNGGVPPPPEPIMPSEFTIHLYNPDQQITVRHKPKTWNSQPAWEFEMPQQSFKQPSSSTLDQIQSGPAVSEVTPKLKFVWKKDGSLSKDFACYLSGKTTTPDGRKKNKEPDITISIFKALRELTLYEPNLYRVEMEDFKGLEVVLMLAAVVIRDVFFAPMKDTFNIVNSPTSSKTNLATTASAVPFTNRPAAPASTNGIAAAQQSTLTLPFRNANTTSSQQNLDPRTKWENDAENARKKQHEEAAKREKRRKAEEEERKTKKLLEAEQKAQRKRQAEIDKETERLQREYGREDQSIRQQRRSSYQSPNPAIMISPSAPAHQARYSHYMPAQQQQRLGPYQQPAGRHHSSVDFRQPQPHIRTQSSSSLLVTGAQLPNTSTTEIPRLKEKRSFLGLFKPSSNADSNRLNKKRSSLF